MGLYLEVDSKGQHLGTKGKADKLIGDGAVEQVHPHYEAFVVCVIDNGPFEAAGFCYSRQEFMNFLQGVGRRPARWLVAESACRKNFRLDTIEEHLQDVKSGPPAVIKERLSREEVERQAREIFGDDVVVLNLDDYDAAP
jgi:hypothetical protein